MSVLYGDSDLLPCTLHELERTRPEKHHESNNRQPTGQGLFFLFLSPGGAPGENPPAMRDPRENSDDPPDQ
jgi:hypothetical protein